MNDPLNWVTGPGALRKFTGFKSQISAQRFLTTRAAINHALDFQRRIISRPTLRLFR